MAYSGAFRVPSEPEPASEPSPPPSVPEPPRRDRRPARPPFLDLGSLFQKTEAAGWETDDLLLALVLYLMYRESGDTDLLIMLAVMLLT